LREVEKYLRCARRERERARVRAIERKRRKREGENEAAATERGQSVYENYATSGERERESARDELQTEEMEQQALAHKIGHRQQH